MAGDEQSEAEVCGECIACRRLARYETLKLAARLMAIFTVATLLGGAIGKMTGNYYIGGAVPALALSSLAYTTIQIAKAWGADQRARALCYADLAASYEKLLKLRIDELNARHQAQDGLNED